MKPTEAALGRQAADYALHMMRTTGSVPATVIADTREGFVFCVPAGLPDEAAKDRFADTARLLVVAHGARAIAMVVEALVRLAKPGGQLDLDAPPSQAPDRQEMVVLMFEDRTRCANTFKRPGPMRRRRQPDGEPGPWYGSYSKAAVCDFEKIS